MCSNHSYLTILPRCACGLKVVVLRKALIYFWQLLQEDISVFTKGERPVLANSVMLCELFKRHETSLPHRFCLCGLHIHNGTSSPRGSLVCISTNVKEWNHIQVVFFFLLPLSEMSN